MRVVRTFAKSDVTESAPVDAYVGSAIKMYLIKLV